MRRRQYWALQLILILALLTILGILINNLLINLIRIDLSLTFAWLLQPAGFALAEYAIPYSPSDTYFWALFVGWLNSLRVITVALIAATILGVMLGTARRSTNYLLRTFATSYVASVRQIPLLLQLLFWYFVVFLGLDSMPLAPLGNLIMLSKEGISLLNVQISAEFSAILVGLSMFTGAAIAEVVRGGIEAVPRGQWEAYLSLGLPDSFGMRRVILPQALPAIIPPLTSQYLNLAKNSTLAIAVGYADLYAVSDTIITQTGRAVEGFLVLLLSFLLLNLLISRTMSCLNALVTRRAGSSSLLESRIVKVQA